MPRAKVSMVSSSDTHTHTHLGGFGTLRRVVCADPPPTVAESSPPPAPRGGQHQRLGEHERLGEDVHPQARMGPPPLP